MSVCPVLCFLPGSMFSWLNCHPEPCLSKMLGHKLVFIASFNGNGSSGPSLCPLPKFKVPFLAGGLIYICGWHRECK